MADGNVEKKKINRLELPEKNRRRVIILDLPTGAVLSEAEAKVKKYEEKFAALRELLLDGDLLRCVAAWRDFDDREALANEKTQALSRLLKSPDAAGEVNTGEVGCDIGEDHGQDEKSSSPADFKSVDLGCAACGRELEPGAAFCWSCSTGL